MSSHDSFPLSRNSEIFAYQAFQHTLLAKWDASGNSPDNVLAIGCYYLRVGVSCAIKLQLANGIGARVQHCCPKMLANNYDNVETFSSASNIAIQLWPTVLRHLAACPTLANAANNIGACCRRFISDCNQWRQL